MQETKKPTVKTVGIRNYTRHFDSPSFQLYLDRLLCATRLPGFYLFGDFRWKNFCEI